MSAVRNSIILYFLINSSYALFGNDGVLSRISSSPTKTAAKAVACHSIAKGICLGVAGVKYTEKAIMESSAESKSELNSKEPHPEASSVTHKPI